MATIYPNKRDGKAVSYKFKTLLGRDRNKKQIVRCTTWTPPDGLTPAKEVKAAERAADAWEQEVKAAFQEEQAQGTAHTLPPEKRHDDFTEFVNGTWFPLQVRGGSHKPSTIAFYQHMTHTITHYFSGMELQQITPMDIQKYLVYLHTEYKSKTGAALSQKSLRHQYGTANCQVKCNRENDSPDYKTPVQFCTARGLVG